MTTQTKDKDERREWQIIFEELLAEADYGDLISYNDLSLALGRNFFKNRTPLYAARAYLGDMRSMWLEAVPTKGYRIIQPNEHMRVAQAHKNRAKRQLSTMIKVGQVTDITRLTPEELASYDSQQKVNAMLYQVAVHHERRLARVESVLAQAGLL